jgi:hypothetical protein
MDFVIFLGIRSLIDWTFQIRTTISVSDMQTDVGRSAQLKPLTLIMRTVFHISRNYVTKIVQYT